MASPDLPRETSPGPLIPVEGGVRLSVKLTPKASRNKIETVVADADGSARLKISVTAVPEDGKANAALIALLAKSWKIAKSAIAITAGTTDRRKTLFIRGDALELSRHLSNHVRIEGAKPDSSTAMPSPPMSAPPSPPALP